MPTKRPRHVFTETPPVQAALDELRQALGDQPLNFAEIVILGARNKLIQLRLSDDRTSLLRRSLADRIRAGNVPVDLEAAEEVDRIGWGEGLMLRALLDNSAWARLRPPSTVAAPRRAEVARAVEAGDIFVCTPFLLEAGYSARNWLEHDELLCELESLPAVKIDGEVEERALAAQGQLSRSGHHRLSPADVMIATLADRYELDVLHYDGDFDILAGKTDLRFGSVWLAERGSL